MKACLYRLLSAVVSALLAYPAIALAAPSSTAPYYTDVANSYVYDQVTQDISALNGFLCLMSAMAPNLMVNGGDYIAMIDANSCFSSGSGGQSSNKGKQYLPVQINSSRDSNSSPMLVKMWLGFEDYFVPLYSSASQAPSKFLPYGIFRIDGCIKKSTDATCENSVGYIDASRSGLAFYFFIKDVASGNFNELALQLSSSSSTNSGSGILVTNDMTNNVLTPKATLFAYSPDYFYRGDGTINACFNRSLNYAQTSAWSYGLYDANTGEHLVHPSGFPIEYTYTSANTSGTGVTGTTYNGYISYYGLSMQYGASQQIVVPTGETVNQISYDTNPPTKKPYTLLKSGGKLTKYKTITQNLSTLNKLPIWYWTYGNNIPVLDGSLSTRTPTAGMLPSNYYEIYWDDAAKNFVVSGEYISGTMQPLATPSRVANSAMATAANGYGLSGWSQLLGGNFSIKGTDFAGLATTLSLTPVNTQTQDVVYPQDYAAINAAGGLQCIGDCPTAAQIGLHNANIAVTAFVSPGWGPFATLSNQSYSLDPASGNLLDSAPVSGNPSGNPVIQTTTTGAIYSGKMVTYSDMATILNLKSTCGTGGPCYSQSDVDLLTNPVYYVWQTSPDSWDQMAFLTDPATSKTVTFYPPLPVNFTVPNTAAYGSLAGSTVSLQYGDFGSLWGIPNKCVDLTSNTDCVFSGGTLTPPANQHWAPVFSIPFSTTDGIVTAAADQGAITDPRRITKGTQFLVKALDKEVRLAQVPVNICTALGLTKPITVSKLPSYADWSDPTPKLGSKPVLNPAPAPQVIDGVKQY